MKTVLQLQEEIIDLKRILGTVQSDLSLAKLEGRKQLIPLMIFNMHRVNDSLRLAKFELKKANLAAQKAATKKKTKS